MATLSKCNVKVSVDFKATDNTAGVNTSAEGVVGWNLGNTFAFSIAGNSINSVNESYYPAAITLSGGANTTIDLTNTTANKNPTNKDLTLARAKIVILTVDATANLVNGVLWNGSAANSTLNVGGTIPVGGAIAWINPTNTANTVDSTHKNIKLENLDATNTATVHIFVAGGRT